MQKQKKGFLLFISSLIPGAGEMYMGLSQLPEGLISPLWLSFFLYYGSTVSSMFIT